MKIAGFEVDRIAGDISKEIVDHLQKRKSMTVQEIAEMAKVSKSFIYRVKQKKARFTVDQFSAINTKMKGDVIAVPEDAPKKLRELYRAFRSVLNA
ncbi:hypothetical protein KKC65_00735 [Patescibacteria group bacterium]|nr:hypothetical protein [Patescibacteria group bacterium]